MPGARLPGRAQGPTALSPAYRGGQGDWNLSLASIFRGSGQFSFSVPMPTSPLGDFEPCLILSDLNSVRECVLEKRSPSFAEPCQTEDQEAPL
ncbi:hypothetical protein PAL_GLEAN10022708 [Pteropus alecto]|uniref:Uncharacterized protein n=1 Tax=Pteropus alecto TaxID=9402 RepID=L5K6T7_PTEAL|nr:hypothetical protein PAL_GLEAN10022708 [Pteropus alecto]